MELRTSHDSSKTRFTFNPGSNSWTHNSHRGNHAIQTDVQAKHKFESHIYFKAMQFDILKHVRIPNLFDSDTCMNYRLILFTHMYESQTYSIHTHVDLTPISTPYSLMLSHVRIPDLFDSHTRVHTNCHISC